ncbi:LysR family transcriptional regulator [Neobacillus sp. NRS-1170]|uniref:LysR family transcriptional regulator n=1 Tax=Neobacillus sp. NRS-1170 TaxID=3233898 RepID=UPI003D280BB5
MRIEQLVYIKEIAKTGSIAITSERLHISSQGISQAIKSLEDELGVNIFIRLRTGLQPTEVGKELIIKAEEFLTKVEEFNEVAKIHSSVGEKHLSISAVTSLCRSIIPQTIASYKLKFPEVKLEIIESTVDQIRKNVLNGDSDLGLIAVPPPIMEKNSHLVSTHFLDSSTLPVEGVETQRSCYSIRLKNQYLSTAAQEFLKELKVHAKSFNE